MFKTPAALIVAMLFGAAAAPLPAHAMTSAAPESTPPSILAFDQKVTDSALVIGYANLPKAGYVAVYAIDENGKPAGSPLGHTRIEAGDHRNVKVSLQSAPKSGDRLWVKLYKDTDSDPAFKPGDGDQRIQAALPAEGVIVVR